MPVKQRVRDYLDRNITQDNYRKWQRLSGLPINFLNELIEYMADGIILPDEILDLGYVDQASLQRQIDKWIKSQDRAIDYKVWLFLTRTLELQFKIDTVVARNNQSSLKSELGIYDLRMNIALADESLNIVLNRSPEQQARPRITSSEVELMFTESVHNEVIEVNDLQHLESDVWSQNDIVDWVTSVRAHISRFSTWTYDKDAARYPWIIGLHSLVPSGTYTYQTYYNSFSNAIDRDSSSFLTINFQKRLLEIARNITYDSAWKDFDSNTFTLHDLLSPLTQELIARYEAARETYGDLRFLSQLSADILVYNAIVERVQVQNAELEAIDDLFLQLYKDIDDTLTYIQQAYARTGKMISFGIFSER